MTPRKIQTPEKNFLLPPPSMTSTPLAADQDHLINQGIAKMTPVKTPTPDQIDFHSFESSQELNAEGLGPLSRG